MRIFFFSDTLHFVLQQDKIRIKLVDHVLLYLSRNLLLVYLILFLCCFGYDLAQFLAQLLVFLGPYLLDVEVQVLPFVMSS